MKTAKLRTKDVTFSDRISHLPDDLLFIILSLIPISDAMYTCLLSKRWKSLWKMMPTLEYDESCCDNIAWRGFNSFCQRSLRLHEALFLKTLTVKLGQNSRDLKLPSSFPNLVVLKLHTVSLYFADSPPSTFCFQSLKSLHLTHVRFRGEEAFSKLTSACPVLEDLFFDGVTTNDSTSFFTISLVSLHRFEIKDNTSRARYGHSSYNYKSRFKINTPSLKYLNLSMEDFCGRLELDEDMPNLVEARLDVDPYKTDELLRFLTSVQFLSIHIYAEEVLLLAEKISHRLLHLELYIYGKCTRNLLLLLLKHAPKLQFLKLQETQRMTRPTARVRKFKDPPPSVCNPSSVPECVSFHLETFQLTGYEGREEEIELV
ncbi:putative F-box/FBD/LRR-repeat protein [Raphanus sativus]|uniref:F-box/FBD/LRR-repeat protein At5g56810 n=1 Tax=Raphanus sativus TaxID=3726 RepID=A0A9W3CEP2_RAPSA|nr:putative F-box/FBD/LRR-repeat protein At5g56810 [Raphanus sativus]KAJ4875351.1 putative F-box/FBD/LRR-repeat protein [Raphanus sativus]